MRTSVLNFHTLRALRNSIRQAETMSPLESYQLRPVRLHALLREFGVQGFSTKQSQETNSGSNSGV